MIPPTENDHPARLLFELTLREIRNVVHGEVAALRDELKQILQDRNPVPRTRRFYSMKEAAAELNVSQATVRRLIERGLLQPSKATRLIRIPGTQIEDLARSTM